MTNLSKFLSIGIALSILLTGCAESKPADVEIEPATVQNVNTDCGAHYMQFLKLGSLDTASVCEELSEATFTTLTCEEANHIHSDGTNDGGEEIWEYSNGINDSYTYRRNICTTYSTMTKTFDVYENDITSWIDVELEGIDTLSGVTGERQAVEGTTWAYSWDAYLENYKLQVFSTGETGHYIALISFSRKGETSVSADAIVDERSDF